MNLENRRLVFYTLFGFVGIVYCARLLYMQVIDDHWKERAAEVSQKKIEVKPPRGIIYDRNKQKIVANKTYYNLMFVEHKIDKLDTSRFAALLGVHDTFIKHRFEAIKKKWDRRTKINGKDTIVNDYRPYLPYAFLSELTADEISAIAPKLGSFKGFYEETFSQRDYPYPYGGNIFGYLNEIRVKELKADPRFYNQGDFVGRTGLENYYENELRGQKGIKYIISSAKGKVVESYAEGQLDTIAKQGPALTLGLDIALQGYGEQLMQNKKGCIVAIEPSTGEILSLVSAPAFDPNLMVGKRKIRKNYSSLKEDSLKPLFPRPLAAEYPPGSIFKLVQALVGLEEGVITENTGFPCTKSLVGCHDHPNANSVQDAVKMSCNPYFYYEVRRIIQQGKEQSVFKDAAIGLAKWEKYMHSFGLGKKPDVDIGGVRPGVIPNVSFYNRWYGEYRWAFSTIRSISIGQGEVKVTPLQMANLAAIIANRGYYYSPHFVRSIGKKGPLEKYTEKKKTMVNSEHFNPVIEGMRRVVEEPGGTARLAKIEGISVAGKTGTAQNPHGKDHSVFIAFAPIDNPKIAIAVYVENAGFGGTWAAPIASLMIEKYLNGEVKSESKEKRILEANLLD
ncbi:MAG: penicillin-binding transpeptidase domain-containing protein [Lishizhenia sp.]